MLFIVCKGRKVQGEKEKKATYETYMTNDEDTELFILKTKQSVGWHDLTDLFSWVFSKTCPRGLKRIKYRFHYTVFCINCMA